MALIKCIECNHDISEFAQSCPHCGCPVSMSINIKQKMDKGRYSVILSQCEVSKVKVIQKIREITGLGLAEAKKIVDDLSFVKINCSIEEANNIKKLIESEGGTVQIIPYDLSHEKNNSVPKCPICNSTNIEKLSFTKRAISIGGLGILSNKIGKTYQCKNCKSTW